MADVESFFFVKYTQLVGYLLQLSLRQHSHMLSAISIHILHIIQNITWFTKEECGSTDEQRLNINMINEYTSMIAVRKNFFTFDKSGGLDSGVALLGDSPLTKLHSSRAAYKENMYIEMDKKKLQPVRRLIQAKRSNF